MVAKFVLVERLSIQLNSLDNQILLFRNRGCFILQENNNVYFLYNNVALLYNNAPKQDQDRKKRTFLRKNQGYHPVLEFYSK